MLFPEKEVKVIAELDLEEAENLACQFKAAVEAHCDRIEVARSIRRQKTKVHDIDFVVVTKNDAEWQKISEKLKHLKAKSNCSGNSVIKAFVPCQNGLFQLDFYRAKPSTFGIYLLVRLARQTITCGLQATPFPKECESGTAKAYSKKAENT